MIRISKLMAAVGVLLALTAHVQTAHAQTAPAPTAETFPNRPITVIVGFAAGGGGDMWSRWMAEFLRERWNVPVVVENKPGAGGTIAAAAVARAKPDGYTVALATASPFTLAPHLQPQPYDPAKDFTYLFQYLVSAQPLFVRADSPHRTMEDLIAWAKANPGQLMWSTAATNGGPHVSTLAAFRALGVQATYVPYKGGADAMTGLLGGQIHALVAAEFPPFLEAGRIRLLAESGPDKIPAQPQLRTYPELGFPVSVPIFYGVAGPAGIAPDVVAKWEDAAREMVRAPGYKDMIARTNSTPAFLDSKAFSASVVGVYHKMGDLVVELGMKK